MALGLGPNLGAPVRPQLLSFVGLPFSLCSGLCRILIRLFIRLFRRLFRTLRKPLLQLFDLALQFLRLDEFLCHA